MKLVVLLIASSLAGSSTAPDQADRTSATVSGSTDATSVVPTAPDTGKLLSRQKRYVVFPKGSSIQFVYCLTVHAYVPLTRIFTFGLTLGLAWQLPTETRQLYIQRREAGQHPDRLHRVKLFTQLQDFLSARGMHGEHCVMRTVCEASQRSDGKGSFMQEIRKVLFTLPRDGYDMNESTAWDLAHFNGTACHQRFPHCPSVIDIPMHHEPE